MLIIVKLIGGLGNQMFQYATGRALANRLGVELLLDTTGFAHYDLRCYELDEWAIQGRVANNSELAMFGNIQSQSRVGRIAQMLGLRKKSPRVFQEPSFAYTPEFMALSSPVYLDGYWQSERYFVDIQKELRQEFVLKQPADAKNQAIASQIQAVGNKSVSLHIRRGDYVTNPHTAQYHGICSLDYYRKAAQYIAERVPSPHFFIFSDDLPWVKDNLQLDYAITLVDANDATKGVWDMALMQKCHNNIIANSSFSWWGAWLNPQPNKIVIAPQQWFSGATHDTRDLIPESWVRL